MNERIRKLAEQAGFVMWSDCDWKPRGEVIDWASNYDDELEKFAELIVRECMDNLAWHGHDEAVSQLDWFLHHKIRS
jgi:hypothetical protein